MKNPEKKFYSSELELELCLSIGEFDTFEDEERLFYIVINDEDDLCYQFAALSYELVLEVFNEIKDRVNEDDFYSKIYPDTCLNYGLFKQVS